MKTKKYRVNFHLTYIVKAIDEEDAFDKAETELAKDLADYPTTEIFSHDTEME